MFNHVNRISAKRLFHFVIRKLLFDYDRRCRFYDLSLIKPNLRKSTSSIIQFYSGAQNIGNYLPVLGIQKMLLKRTDCWNMHDKLIDLDFINKNYKCAIIGGAGLLNKVFEHFWEKLLHECKLPMIIWGVGVCLPDGDAEGGVDRAIVSKVAGRCELINVRDDLTADYYKLQDAHISLCPSVVYLAKYTKDKRKSNGRILFASVDRRDCEADVKVISGAVRQVGGVMKHTDNIQHRFLGLEDIISRYYCKCDTVVTTRLHGAIIAYSLGVPYVAVPRDEKVRAFCGMYGNGVVVKEIEDVEDVLKGRGVSMNEEKETNRVLEFGDIARKWAESR